MLSFSVSFVRRL